MNVSLFSAGVLAVLAAGVHGLAGERLVLRKLFDGGLPPTYFGGASMTKAMLHATWHITSLAFLSMGVAMIVSATVLEGDAAQAVAVVSAAAFTSFAAAAVVFGMRGNPLQALRRHPGPLALSAAAALAWVGAL